MGKRESAGNQYFLLFPQGFQKAISSRFRPRDCVVKSYAADMFCLAADHFDKQCGRKENMAHHEQFLIPTRVCCVSMYLFNPSQTTDFRLFQEFADDNFKFDENGTKFSKWIENTVGKGEIAHYEQFLLFSQCFQKACTADT